MSQSILSRRIQAIARKGMPETLAVAAQRRTVEDAFLFADNACRCGRLLGQSEIVRIADSLSRLYAGLETPPKGVGIESKMATLYDEAIARRRWLAPGTLEALHAARASVARIASNKHRQFVV